MSSLFDSNGCAEIRDTIICRNNLTLIYYDGQPRRKSECNLDSCSMLISNWGYLPNVAGNVVFVALFGTILLLQLPLGIWKRTWGVLIGMTVGCLFEILGYLGRVMAHGQPFEFNPFLIYIIFLTIGPALFTAAIYLCLARIIVVYGQDNARFRPRTYSIVFMVSDFISLLLQGAGGGIASTADDDNTSQAGIDIMIAGLGWQVFSLIMFSIAAADFAWCVRRGRGVTNPSLLELRNSSKFKGFLYALATATLTIFIRSVYRVAELSQGFTGKIADNEPLFMVFEPTMIVIACICLTVWHPSFVFGDSWRLADFRLGKGKNYSELELRETGEHT